MHPGSRMHLQADEEQGGNLFHGIIESAFAPASHGTTKKLEQPVSDMTVRRMQNIPFSLVVPVTFWGAGSLKQVPGQICSIKKAYQVQKLRNVWGHRHDRDSPASKYRHFVSGCYWVLAKRPHNEFIPAICVKIVVCQAPKSIYVTV